MKVILRIGLSTLSDLFVCLFSFVILGMYPRALPMSGICFTTEIHPLSYPGLCSISGSGIYFIGFNHDFPSLEGYIVCFTLGMVECERLLMKTWALVLLGL